MSQIQGNQPIGRISRRFHGFLFRSVVVIDRLTIVKPMSTCLVVALLCCNAALPYPRDYGPFEASEEPPRFPVEPCERVQHTPAVSISADFSFSCADAPQQISVTWNPINERFTLEMADTEGTPVIPRTEIEGVLAGSVGLCYADLNADKRED